MKPLPGDRPLFWSAVVIALAVVIYTATAKASIPGNDGITWGCYATSGIAKGALRVIDRDNGEKCKLNEKMLPIIDSYTPHWQPYCVPRDGTNRMLAYACDDQGNPPGQTRYIDTNIIG